MTKKYFINRGLECYCSALANLLVEIGDEQTAHKVFDDYKHTRLASKDGGMHIGLVTRALSELTKERYEGTLTASFDDNYDANLRKSFPAEADFILRIMKEEREKGRIKSHNGRIYHSLPAIFFIKINNDNHYNVCVEENVFIDDGRRGHFPMR